MRRLMRRVRSWSSRPEAALFAICLGSYAYFYQAGGWNQNSRFDLVRALVERGTPAIDAYERNTGDKARRAGHTYCDKAPGLSLLGVPAYAAMRAAFGPARDERPSPGFLAAAAHVTGVFAVGLPSALSVLALVHLLAAFGLALLPRLGAAAAYALATLAFPYSTLLYGHQLSAALTLSAFALLVAVRRRDEVDPPGARRLVAAGALCGAAIMVEYQALLALGVIGLYAAWSPHPARRIVWFAVGAVPVLAALLLYHALVFGSPFALPYDFSTQRHRSMGFFMGLGAPDRHVLREILFSSYRGLFFSAPWLLLAVPGGVWLWRRRRRAEVAVSAAIVLLYIWLNASLVDWQGGWAMGPRYLVPCIPFLAILAAGLLSDATSGGNARRQLMRAVRGLAGAAAIYSAFLMLVGTAVKPEVPVWIRRPFGDYLLPAFARGQLAISTQSIDSANASRGPRQAWNLGELVGLRGLASLAPLVAGWTFGAVWLAWRARRLRTASTSTKMQL